MDLLKWIYWLVEKVWYTRHSELHKFIQDNQDRIEYQKGIKVTKKIVLQELVAKANKKRCTMELNSVPIPETVLESGFTFVNSDFRNLLDALA